MSSNINLARGLYEQAGCRGGQLFGPSLSGRGSCGTYVHQRALECEYPLTAQGVVSTDDSQWTLLI